MRARTAAGTGSDRKRRTSRRSKMARYRPALSASEKPGAGEVMKHSFASAGAAGTVCFRFYRPYRTVAHGLTSTRVTGYNGDTPATAGDRSPRKSVAMNAPQLHRIRPWSWKVAALGAALLSLVYGCDRAADLPTPQIDAKGSEKAPYQAGSRSLRQAEKSRDELPEVVAEL